MSFSVNIVFYTLSDPNPDLARIWVQLGLSALFMYPDPDPVKAKLTTKKIRKLNVLKILEFDLEGPNSKRWKI
jgi:hypothetical protein